MQIRAAKKSDLKNVEKLFCLPELAKATGEFLSVETLANYIDDKFFLAAEEAGEIIGAMFGERLKNAGLILWEFAVKESARGRGVGSALLDAFESNMAFENRTWVILYAPARSPKTINFYKKRGFNKGKLHVEFLKFFDNRHPKFLTK